MGGLHTRVQDDVLLSLGDRDVVVELAVVGDVLGIGCTLVEEDSVDEGPFVDVDINVSLEKTKPLEKYLYKKKVRRGGMKRTEKETPILCR